MFKVNDLVLIKSLSEDDFPNYDPLSEPIRLSEEALQAIGNVAKITYCWVNDSFSKNYYLLVHNDNTFIATDEDLELIYTI